MEKHWWRDEVVKFCKTTIGQNHATSYLHFNLPLKLMATFRNSLSSVSFRVFFHLQDPLAIEWSIGVLGLVQTFV